MWLFPFGMPWVPFLAIGLAFAGVYWLQFQKRRKRARSLAMIAATIGFDFSVTDIYGLETMPFTLFKQGKGRKAQNVLSGVHNNLPLQMFDYEYYVQNRNREYHRFTCAVMTIPAACPGLCLTHENAATWLVDKFGFHDVELEYDDFNRRFRVACEQKFAFTMFDGQMMEWLLGADGFDRVEVLGPWVLIARRPQEPAAWTNLGNWLDAFHAHIPPVVYSTYPPR